MAIGNWQVLNRVLSFPQNTGAGDFRVWSDAGGNEYPLTIFLLIAFFIRLFFAYAEIHYRLPGFPGRLFKKEPEIVFDLPHRARRGSDIPLFLFIKDAHRFPVELLELQIRITSPAISETQRQEIPPGQAIHSRFFSRIFWIPPDHFPEPGNYEITAELTCQSGGKRLWLRQDNYPGISHEPLRIYISDSPLPSLPNLYWGDLHTHSNYTDDQIEFGAPLRESLLCARAVGLHFLGVTDHSYDLDDTIDNFLENDPALPKWQKLWQETGLLNQEFPGFTLLAGEEVSAGNSQKQNVHCLLLGNRTYYPGAGDSGERPWNNRPTLALGELFQNIKNAGEETVIAAAHPFDEPPPAHRLVLNRGFWQEADLRHAALDYWQILNGRVNRFFQTGRRKWIAALLNRQKIGILGGSDAHGNFNCSRQIRIPFWKIVKGREQLLGEMRTGIFSETPLNPNILIQRLKAKRAIISSGPAVALEIRQNELNASIGDTIQGDTNFTATISAASSPEYGNLISVKLYVGNYKNSQETEKLLKLPPACYHFQETLEFSAGLPAGYLRLEVFSEKNQNTCFCFTNPVWIEE